MNKRIRHILKANKNQERPNLLIFLDTETTVSSYVNKVATHTFKLGWALFWKRQVEDKADTLQWYEIKDIAAFWTWVNDHSYDKTRLILTSHNLDYDLMILKAFTYLPDLGWELKSYYSKGQTTLVKWRKGNRTLEALDNGNWFKGKLSRWGKLIGFPKLPIDFKNCSDEELSTYCKRDVKILFKLWSWWFDYLLAHNLGTWAKTLPSQAFNSFRHGFMHHAIYLHTSPQATNLELESYHGGRVEVLRKGTFTNGPFYKLDVNSMYPAVMQGHNYPTRLKYVLIKPSVKRLTGILKRFAVVARVTVDCNEPWFCTKVKGYQCYPVGRFITTLTTPELKLAIRKGCIQSVDQAAIYSQAPIFDAYVNYFYPLKERYHKEGNMVLRELTKDFLNMLYGKFGQRGLNERVIGNCSPDRFESIELIDHQTRTRYQVLYLGGKVIERKREGLGFNAFPAIAAHVTGYARLKLYKLVQRARRENCYYADTDCVITNEKGYRRLRSELSESDLGKLKVEGKTGLLTILAKKDYRFGSKTVCKGIRPTATVIAPNTYEQEMFPSITGLLRDGRFGDYYTRLITKVLSREIHSGLVCDDGFVKPFTLDLTPPLLTGKEKEKLEKEIALLEIKLAGYETVSETLPSATVVFKLWDYRHNKPRKVRDKYGNLVNWWEAQADEMATELGYQRSDSLLQACRKAVKVRYEVNTLTTEIKAKERSLSRCLTGYDGYSQAQSS